MMLRTARNPQSVRVWATAHLVSFRCISKIVSTPEEAVKDIKSGSKLLVGCVCLSRIFFKA
jgi:hypothetical protein